MNKVTIHNIKKQLHELFGNIYEKNIKKIKKLQSDKNVMYGTKYFVINVRTPKDMTKQMDYFDVVYAEEEQLYIKSHIWQMEKNRILIQTNNTTYILIIEPLNENNIQILKIRKKTWGTSIKLCLNHQYKNIIIIIIHDR
jgi:aspartate/glutamate racemase